MEGRATARQHENKHLSVFWWQVGVPDLMDGYARG